MGKIFFQISSWIPCLKYQFHPPMMKSALLIWDSIHPVSQNDNVSCLSFAPVGTHCPGSTSRWRGIDNTYLLQNKELQTRSRMKITGSVFNNPLGPLTNNLNGLLTSFVSTVITSLCLGCPKRQDKFNWSGVVIPGSQDDFRSISTTYFLVQLSPLISNAFPSDSFEFCRVLNCGPSDYFALWREKVDEICSNYARFQESIWIPLEPGAGKANFSLSPQRHINLYDS